MEIQSDSRTPAAAFASGSFIRLVISVLLGLGSLDGLVGLRSLVMLAAGVLLMIGGWVGGLKLLLVTSRDISKERRMILDDVDVNRYSTRYINFCGSVVCASLRATRDE